MHPPKVFISATSGDLRSVRQMVKEALLTINCHPVEQTNFGPDWRTVEGMLRAKIADCQALIHIVGLRYGAEPDPATLPAGAPRRSYTQMEYHLGCELHEQRGDAGFRVYTFICPEGFPYDEGAAPEPVDKAELQRAHRAALQDNPRLYERPKQESDIHARVLTLQEQVLTLKQQSLEARDQVRRSYRVLLAGMLAIVLLIAVLLAAQVWMKTSHSQELGTMGAAHSADLKKMEASIAASLTAAVKHGLALNQAEAAKSDNPADADRLKQAAQAQAAAGMARVPAEATRLIAEAVSPDATEELKEMTRILGAEGLEAALSYVEGKRTTLLLRASGTADMARRHALLQPLLTAAQLKATQGAHEVALADYQALLEVDARWPKALLALASLYGDLRRDFGNWGPRKDLEATFLSSSQAVAHSKKLHELSPEAGSGSGLVLANALTWHADVLLQRGGPGHHDEVFRVLKRSVDLSESCSKALPNSTQAIRDEAICLQKLANYLILRDDAGAIGEALPLYGRSLGLSEKILQENPSSTQALRDMSSGLNRFGDAQLIRGGPDAADIALMIYTRSLELNGRLRQNTADSMEVMRDTSICHQKLGQCLAMQGPSADPDLALEHFTLSLGLLEKVLQNNPASIQAARDVHLLLAQMGNLLATRNQPGDSAEAERHLTRAQELAEKLMKDNPGSLQAMGDVSYLLASQADFLTQRNGPGDLETALQHRKLSLALLEDAAQDIPGSARSVQNICARLNKLGTALTRRGQPGDARAATGHFTRAVQLAETQHQARPESAQATRQLWTACLELANHFERTGKGDALSLWKRSLELLQEMKDRNMLMPTNDLSVLEWLKDKVKSQPPARP